MITKQIVQVGQVVAVERGRGNVNIARITAVSSSGDTVDIVVLRQIVKEMYAVSKEGPTYEPVVNVRPVISEFVPSQEAWIVLDRDLEPVKSFFETRALSNQAPQQTVQINAAPPRVLSPEALKRQFFTPTKTQAFWGALLSLPLSALFYSLFASARRVYSQNPAGEDFLSGELFRKIVLYVACTASVSALLIGSSLFLYAISKSEGEGTQS